MCAGRTTDRNQTFVNQFFKDKNPIGQQIGSPESPGDFEVVGVVEDTAYTDVRWKNHRSEPDLCESIFQRPEPDRPANWLARVARRFRGCGSCRGYGVYRCALEEPQIGTRPL